jgi:hypothetical protein
MRGSSVLILFAVLLALLSGCATEPPVQEMSDARQAVAAAREAGAGQYAPAMLREAEARLSEAEQSLNRGDTAPNWSFARRDALAAKEIALDALLRSREARERDAAGGQ